MTAKGLYLVYESLTSGVIDSQVMVHAQDMRSAGIIDFEIWAFVFSAKMAADGQTRLEQFRQLSGSRIRLFRALRPAIPFSGVLNALRLWWLILTLKPAFRLIHARNDYAATVASYLKLLWRCRLIWDCRGDSEAEFVTRYTGTNPVIRLAHGYQLAVIRWRRWLVTRQCDTANFVSRPLRERFAAQTGGKPTQVIPCVASETLFFYDPALRETTRQRLGYTAEDRVILYAGGLSHYQCLPESIELFRQLVEQDQRYKLLIVTQQTQAVQQLLAGLPAGSYQVCRAEIAEVNAYSNAADFGLMLRKADPLNAVASPTKFAEYSLAGLPVIMTDSVIDSYALARQNGNLCEYRDGEVTLHAVSDRQAVSARYRAVLSRSAVLPRYRALYS